MFNLLGWFSSFLAVYSVNELDNVPAGLVCFLFAVAFFRAARGRRVPIICRITDALTREKPVETWEEEPEDIPEEWEEEEPEEEPEEKEIITLAEVLPAQVVQKPRTAQDAMECAKKALKAENQLIALQNKRERLLYINGGSELSLSRLKASRQWRALEYDIAVAEMELREYSRA